jgi:hypothetical protein
MCTFVVKHTNGIPTRAKSRIVVLGNLEQRSWTKADCFSPLISIPMIRFLTALAVQNGRPLQQADCKFAFHWGKKLPILHLFYPFCGSVGCAKLG